MFHVATITELPKYVAFRDSTLPKDETMDPLHVATLTVKRELPKYETIVSI